MKHSIVACSGRGRGAFAGGAHAGLNHAGALADAADADGLAAQLELHGDLFGPRVAGHDGFGRLGGVVRRGPQFDGGLDDAGADIVHRQRDADAARWSRRGPSLAASASACSVKRAISRASFKPCLPVQALALPELTTTAWALPFLTRSTQTFTGAAQAWLVVNMPATVGRHIGDNERQVAFSALVRAFAGAEPFDVAEDAAGAESPAARRWNRKFF